MRRLYIIAIGQTILSVTGTITMLKRHMYVDVLWPIACIMWAWAWFIAMKGKHDWRKWAKRLKKGEHEKELEKRN